MSLSDLAMGLREQYDLQTKLKVTQDGSMCFVTLTRQDVEDIEQASNRLVRLDRWLESRGLPKDSPMEIWHQYRWILSSDFHTELRIVGGNERDPEPWPEEFHRRVRWDLATQEQRDAAREMEEKK